MLFPVAGSIIDGKGCDKLEIDIGLILALIAVGAGAAFIQRVSGFGSGIFSMLFLPYLFGNTVTAAAVSGMWSCATTVFNAIRHRKNVQFKLILPILIPAMIMVTLSVQFSKKVPAEAMMIVLGSVLVLLSLYFLFFSQKICAVVSGTTSLVTSFVTTRRSPLPSVTRSFVTSVYLYPNALFSKFKCKALC